MGTPYIRAPHQEGSNSHAHAPNAALLIDFDNVTMGMRSDLSRELKTLLNSDIIKGKVTVQRAYADWRRYPQYIVPLSEASVDLIFAPAYGSSKKNATDIRMAIDAVELIFVRPEIGTFILLTGDSDFSSCVLKLKEYGKYVIGVGIQESSSDLLVQNCDEYYSYTSLTGLRKTTEGAGAPADPWELVEKAIRRMESRNDVMRSDRLKQVMLELDPSFDEGNHNFSKFSRFLTEAASRKLVSIRKMENGQYEVHPGGGGGGAPRTERAPSPPSGRESPRRSGRSREPRGREREVETEVAPDGPPLDRAYALLRKALRELTSGPGDAVRDSDVKRKMLAHDESFDESELGFSKFSRFLRQAHDQGVVVLRKRESGNYEVELAGEGGSSRAEAPPEAAGVRKEPSGRGGAGAPRAEPGRSETGEVSPPEPPETPLSERATEPMPGRRLGPRRGERPGRRGKEEGPPPLLPGQAVGPDGGASEAPATGGSRTSPQESSGAGAGTSGPLDADDLGLPTDPEAAVRYLSNSYAGVGEKTAETLVNALGEELFPVLQNDPDRVRELVPPARAEKVLEGWRTDYERRATDGEEAPGGSGETGESRGRRRSRRSRRGRSGS